MATEDSQRSLLVAKVTAMLVLFCVTALVGAIPYLLNCCFKWTERDSNARSAKAVQCLLQFGGGVLLCTTFVHLLPEVQDIVDQLQYCQFIPQLSFALAETLMCAGFFLMYLIEECIHAYIHRRNSKVLEQDKGAGAAFERGHSARNSVLVAVPQRKESQDVENGVLKACTITEIGVASKVTASTKSAGLPMHSHEHGGHSHLPLDTGVDDVDTVSASLRGLLIVLALSIHELFEGMAIGLEESASAVWFMFSAIAAHKLVLAFCVGVELLVARTRGLLSAIYILTFSIVSPIGIGIGILISANQDAEAPSLTSAILQGLACGTLLYVVFYEILSKEHAGFGTFISLLIGFALMLGLMQLGGEDDSENTSCGSGSSVNHNAYKVLTTHVTIA